MAQTPHRFRPVKKVRDSEVCVRIFALFWSGSRAKVHKEIVSLPREQLSFCPLVAQRFLDKGKWPLTDDKALLASIATNYLLLPYSAISKHAF